MSFTVLFLCTGNYYRSRFAEILLNHLAAGRIPHLHAVSRGIATELGIHNVGPMSPHALAELQRLGIQHESTTRFPRPVKDEDFKKADLIIALDDAEHREMMRQRHPDWADRIEYWNIPDTWAAPPEQALPALITSVKTLLQRLTPS